MKLNDSVKKAEKAQRMYHKKQAGDIFRTFEETKAPEKTKETQESIRTRLNAKRGRPDPTPVQGRWEHGEFHFRNSRKTTTYNIAKDQEGKYKFQTLEGEDIDPTAPRTEKAEVQRIKIEQPEIISWNSLSNNLSFFNNNINSERWDKVKKIYEQKTQEAEKITDPEKKKQAKQKFKLNPNKKIAQRMSTGDIRFCSSEGAYILKKDDVIVINFSKEGSGIEDSYKISNEGFKKGYTNAKEIIDSFAGTNVTKE